ncbi:hypothetical protein [Chryseosolibacter indicus]|uniref:Uncharacterized protein n=1 Tax=Chryseosolibacter indicus TaxID=2782351 RepID=A0ABS5VLN1_9BACT|nr:hypothetical protein [Chryseosolibacter indicus]MBT1702373.1 hypothetical protein [Chryseosolibacter indicus]
MNQQPDKFFQKKLKNFSKPVPTTAWNRVAEKLDKKKDRYIWMKVAASVLIICTTTLVFLNLKDNSQSQLALTNKEESTAPRVKKNVLEIPKAVIPDTSSNKINPLPAQSKQSVRKATEKPGQTNKNSDNIPAPRHEKQEEFATQNPIAHLNEQETKRVGEQSTEELATVTESKNVTAQKSLTIVYEAEEINEKYLNKNEIEEATSESKKTSTLRKLLDKANDLGNNQDPFGDLRQKKNEILALNFKNEKQRSQKR